VSADLLRRAAAKLRAHAEAATRGPWYRAGDHERAVSYGFPPNAIGYWDGEYAAQVSYNSTGDGAEADADARFMALMHPPVALALAEWLEAMAAMLDQTYGISPVEQRVDRAALLLARAILREDS
jgi:hypothetical protein